MILEAEKVKTANLRMTSSGEYHYIWDGVDQDGMPLPCGVYFIRCVSMAKILSVGKIVLVK